MFFKQIRRNAAKNRKGNSLFFGSLVIAIVAFYTLLSIDKQDVIRFLKTIESDAVNKLLMLIPIVYAVSLFFVFFLVYFSYHYQMNERRKELGMYLMLGMKQSRLFVMLIGETILNSIISLVIGLPIALFLTEAISLVTVKAADLGVIGHEVTWSFEAVAETVLGLILVQLSAMFILSVKFARKVPAELLTPDTSDTQKIEPARKRIGYFILGVLLLLFAYGIGVTALDSLSLFAVAAILVSGISGTFLLYMGLGSVIGERLLKKSMKRAGLYTFTGRQIQGNVLCQYKALAVSSLLLLLSMACLSYGIGVTAGSRAQTVKTTDFSIEETEEGTALKALESEESKKYISEYYPMFLDMINSDDHSISEKELEESLQTLKHVKNQDMADNIAENLEGREGFMYVISLSSYNNLLKSIGKKEIKLTGNQAAVYTSMGEYRDFTDIFHQVLKDGTHVEFDGVSYELVPELYYDNIVADREITLYYAYIIPDALYDEIVMDGGTPFCYNAVIKQDFVEKTGFVKALEKTSEIFDKAGLQYENYLSGTGRRLFYTVAGSYITIYLGILFMIIADTVIGIKYLMQQQAGKERYRLLMMLGAGLGDIRRSAAKQIRIFFGMVLGVSAVSGVFAVWSMFNGFMRLPEGADAGEVMIMACAAFGLFILIQFVYIMVIEKIGRKEIRHLSLEDRRQSL